LQVFDGDSFEDFGDGVVCRQTGYDDGDDGVKRVGESVFGRERCGGIAEVGLRLMFRKRTLRTPLYFENGK
jgi:hypothetical protein